MSAHPGPGRDDRADAVIVGGGLAGLAAAVRLAAAHGGSRRILLLEAGAHLGGRARTTEHRGHHLGFGPRALYRHSERLLARLGVRPSGGEPDVARGLALYGGELHRGYASPAALLTTKLLSVRERIAVARLLALTKGGEHLAGLDGREWLERQLPTERARSAAYALLRMSAYAGRPAALSADALAAHFAGVRPGVRYVDGGWQSVVDALRDRARELGVRVRTGVRVTGVEGGPAPYVRCAAGAGVRSRAVILAGLPPADVEQLLDSPGFLPRAGAPLHTACLDVALSRLPEPRHGLVYGVDEPVYLAVFTASARLAPPGGVVLHAARYDDGTPASAAEHRARLRGLLDAYQPGWRDHVVHERFLPRMTTMSAVPQARTGGLRGRPDVRVPGRPGVLLAGDWVGPAGLLADAVLDSAVRAGDEAAALL